MPGAVPGRGPHLRVRPLAFPSGPAQSPVSGRSPLRLRGFLPECLSGPTVYAVSSGGCGLAGACRLSEGLVLLLIMGLLGPWGGAALGSLGSELLLGCTRSSILLRGVFTVRPFCKPLLLIC